MKLKRAGANCVSTYIPWNWHMPREDLLVFDDYYRQWHVAEYYSRNLDKYIEITHNLGLKLIARPGPYICSEWDSGGHPNWLYSKTLKPRSLDREYMYWTRKWYEAVLQVLSKYSDLVEIIQVENEYFWGNEKYITELKRIVESYFKDKLIVTNENHYLKNIVNTIDDYPQPWSISSFDSKLERYLASQPGFFKMIMELEGGWFSANRYGYYPTNILEIPSSWTEMLLKTSIAKGIYNINIYMFHGGTNPGYYTGKYITSSYDYGASVRENGELSDRYYAVKRLYMFTSSFKELLINSKPLIDSIRPLYKCSDLIARVSSNGIIVVLRNLSNTVCYQKILIGGNVIPYVNGIRVHPKSAKLILLNYNVNNTPFIVRYSTAEPLINLKWGDTQILVFYGKRGEEIESFIEVRELFRARIIQGDIFIDIFEKGIRETHIQQETDVIVLLESGNSRLLVVFTNDRRASRTWYIDEIDPPMLLISNLYFVGDIENIEEMLSIKCELDDESHGAVLLLSNREVKNVSINGLVLLTKKIEREIYEFKIPVDVYRSQARCKINLKDFHIIEDPVDYEYTVIDAKSSLESLGLYDNGLYVYKIKFYIDEETLQKYNEFGLAIVGVHDYAIVLLNNYYLGSGYHVVESKAKHMLKKGENELKVILESTGHMNDGLIYVPNGFIGDIYIGVGEHITLRTWRKIDISLPINSEFDIIDFLQNPVTYIHINDHSKAYVVEFPEGEGLYVKELYLEKLDGHYILDLGYGFYVNHPPRIVVFINNYYIGPYRGLVDITKYLKQGHNKIMIYTDWHVLYPTLRNYKVKVEGSWSVQELTLGLFKEWYKSKWSDATNVTLPLSFERKAGTVYWLKTHFNLDQKPSSARPLKLTVRSSGLRLLIFINGNLIGRLYDETPSNELYIPEDALRLGLNELVIMVLVSSQYALLESIKLENYFVHDEVKINLNLTNP